MTAQMDAWMPLVDGVLAQRRIHVVGVIHFERRAQRILENRREFLRLFRREMAGNLAVAGDFAVDGGRGIKLAVQNDGQPPADVVPCDIGEPFRGGRR